MNASDGAGTAGPEPGTLTQADLDHLNAEVARHHDVLRALRRGANGQALAAGTGWDALDRLHAEGQRLHEESARLRAERERGLVDRAALDRLREELAAHREALRRFRSDAQASPSQ
jgi:hypothetical protein